MGNRKSKKIIIQFSESSAFSVPYLNHAFRVAFNRRLHEMGLSPSDRALILGHSVETNERHYSFTDSRRLETIRQRMLSQEADVLRA